MSSRATIQHTESRQSLRGHVGELAHYCGVPTVRVVWWTIAGVPAGYRRQVKRFTRVIDSLERLPQHHLSRALMRLVVRAEADRRLVQSTLFRPARRRRYRIIVRQ